MFKHWPDWLIRAVKTFVQAFFGVMIPVVCGILSDGIPADFGAVKVTLISALMASLAAGISAVWNISLEVHGNLKSCGK